MKFPGMITDGKGDVHAKGQGQRSMAKVKANFWFKDVYEMIPNASSGLE